MAVPRPPKVSICVPVYNVESWLPAALDSALEQSLKDIEIVCVDDGSTDGSLAILQKYAAKDPRVKVLENGKNRGTLYARVRAALATEGDYVLWLDPDDELFPDIARLAYEKAEETGAEVVIFSYEVRRRGKTRWVPLPDYLPGRQPGSDILDLLAQQKITWNLYNKLWSGILTRAVATELKPFVQSRHVITAEDLLFFWLTARQTDSYALLPSVGYLYWADRGAAARKIGDVAFRRKYISDISAVIGKIFSGEETDVDRRRAEQTLRAGEANMFRQITSLPERESWAAFQEYLAAFPADVRERVRDAMARFNPQWYGAWRAAKALFDPE
ncbi:MAG: glycosyltransferase [Puniceicoccales bacterium]|nr:glycosyltransferase [Puniceicoccales bacterium]